MKFNETVIAFRANPPRATTIKEYLIAIDIAIKYQRVVTECAAN
jgi:hypothetical protein